MLSPLPILEKHPFPPTPFSTDSSFQILACVTFEPECPLLWKGSCALCSFHQHYWRARLTLCYNPGVSFCHGKKPSNVLDIITVYRLEGPFQISRDVILRNRKLSFVPPAPMYLSSDRAAPRCNLAWESLATTPCLSLGSVHSCFLAHIAC